MIKTSSPETRLNRVDFLKKVPLFAALDEEVVVRLIQDFRVRTYNKGDIIFHQGDISRSLYVIQRGKVRVYHLSPNGEETTITILAQRQIVGEFALVDGKPRSATAQAITTCTLLEMTDESCLHHMAHIPELALAMCRQLVRKTRWTSMYAETIARFDTAGRLLHFLLCYNEDFGEEIEPGKRYMVDLGLNQTDLATLVGAQRGWVNHILQDWRKRGLVEFDAGKLIILDLPCIEAELERRLDGTAPEW